MKKFLNEFKAFAMKGNVLELVFVNIWLFHSCFLSGFLYRGSCFISILNEQYRMNEFLYRFSNKYFYENKMITRNDNKLDENVMMKLPFPDKIIPSFFYHHTEKEKEENNSYYNENEINKALYFSEKLIEAGVNPKDIGIITLYNAQKFRLIEKFQKSKLTEMQAILL